MDDESLHVPRFAYNDAIRERDKYQQKYLETQVKLDRHTVRESVNDALAGLDPNVADVNNLRTLLEAHNLRAEGDKGLIDFDIDGKTLTVSPKEGVEMMMGRPDEYGNLFNRPKPRELTPSEKHLAWLQTLTPQQFMAYRQKRGPGYTEPEPPAR